MLRLSNYYPEKTREPFRINTYEIKYVTWYNNRPKNVDGITAVSSLRNNRLEYQERIESFLTRQEEIKSKLLEYIQAIPGENENPYCLKNQINMYCNLVFPHNVFLENFQPDLEKMISELYSNAGMLAPLDIKKFVKKAFEIRKELEFCINNRDAIKKLTDKILKDRYPQEITPEIYVLPSRKVGKQNDPTAPQQEIKKHVLMLYYNAQNNIPGFEHFIHQSPKRKGKPHKVNITKDVMDKDVSGLIDIEAVYKRVSQALKEIDTNLS